ncbi:MAG: alpha/beta hydrolase-fold protein [Candidatus Zixiibacteriota bacterium]
MKRILFGLILICLIISLMVSCGKRENPIRDEYPSEEPWILSYNFPSLQGNLIQDPSVRDMYVYLPPQYDPINHPPQSLNGFPVLYLLHDFGEDNQAFTFIYKVAEVADRMIAENQINPMILVMPDASSTVLASDPYKTELGGTFYVNSLLLGKYEDYIAHDIVDSIEANFATVGTRIEGVWIPNRDYHAISGHGMGGYGALRIAMDYDTLLFNSVSAISPYASFETFLTRQIIDKLYEENGFASDDFSYASYKKLNPWTDPSHSDKTYSQLIFAMAAAFSPHDPNDPDTTNFFVLVDIGGTKYGGDLPFDASRTVPPGSPIWNRWLSQDIKTHLVNEPDAFANLSIYFDCGDQDQLGLYNGTRALDQLLSLYGKEHTYMEYSGYSGYPADHNHFVHDRLPDILKFHSQHFGPPKWERK